MSLGGRGGDGQGSKERVLFCGFGWVMGTGAVTIINVSISETYMTHQRDLGAGGVKYPILEFIGKTKQTRIAETL